MEIRNRNQEREKIDKAKEYDKLFELNLRLLDEVKLLKDDKTYFKGAFRDISNRISAIIRKAQKKGVDAVKLSDIKLIKKNIDEYNIK